MGLDKEILTCLNRDMKRRLLKLFGIKEERKSPIAKDRERFEAEVKEQFQKLKDKGLSIPVFTL
jgi:hypothetical protein